MKLVSLFRTIVPITLATVFLVILAGGVVRTTGSGMGCPDWPKCFGRYIPPTDISQLPADYKTRFAVKGKEIADFEPFKTWTEYVNRLLGALLGVFVFVQLLSSVSHWRTDKLTVMLCAGMLLMTGFVGWLGSVVVATDLQPVKITIHMLTALLILALSLGIFFRARATSNAMTTRTPNSHISLQTHSQLQTQQTIAVLAPWLYAATLLTLVQVVMGTQVREQIDEIAKSFSGEQRELWVDKLNAVFYIHRSFSIAVALVNGWIVYRITTGLQSPHILRMYGTLLVCLIGVEIMSGVVMAYFAVPKAAQPLHLLLSTGMFAVQVLMVLSALEAQKRVAQ